jgi:DNA-binding MarR family transcriptional regulator
LIAIAVLLDRPIGGENATNLARRFGVAPMSVVRAFDELQAAGLADTSRVGRERTLKMKAQGRDLWREIEVHLQSPVRKVRRVAIPYPEHFPGLVAGESALAHYTPLASPRVQTLAVPAAHWGQLFREYLKEAESRFGYGDEIETWSYDPAVLGEHRMVVKLSLYLEAGAYERKEKSEGGNHYRFAKPATCGFPYMIELFHVPRTVHLGGRNPPDAVADRRDNSQPVSHPAGRDLLRPVAGQPS